MPINDFGITSANYKNWTWRSATGSGSVTVTLKSGPGKLAGILITTAATTPTLTVSDTITEATVIAGTGSVIMSTFTPVAGTLYRFGANIQFVTGLMLYSTGSVVGTVAFY